MYYLILLFFEIAIFRKGPQDVPFSLWLLKFILPFYFAVNLLILLLNDNGATALFQLAVDFLLVVGLSWPLLYYAGKTARYPQTLSALLGTDTVISFFAIPAIASLNTEASDLAFLAMLVLMGWHWLVSGHIFRHALDQPLFFGLGVALLYILISSQVMELLFPAVPTQS